MRPTHRIAATMQRQDLPPPPITLTEPELAHYRAVLSGLPSHLHRSTAACCLSAAVAQVLHEIEEASRILSDEGLVSAGNTGPKPHPAVQIRDAAHKRLAALLSRLKMLPSADARELGRQAAFETRMRSPAPLAIAAPAPSPLAAVDWVAIAAAEKNGASGV